MARISARVDNWKTTWESRDPDRVAAMYSQDGTHQSSLIARVWPELGRTILHGRDEIRDYASRGLARYKQLHFEILTSTEEGDRAAVEYRRHSNIDGGSPAYVLELIEWSRGLITSCRVFHF
jgi:nuclear transport factor 2 (NTF2) superfamily protein